MEKKEKEACTLIPWFPGEGGRGRLLTMEHEQATKERYPLLGHIVSRTEDIVQTLKTY